MRTIEKWQLDRLVVYLVCAYLGAWMVGCGGLTIGPEMPPTGPVECGSNAWGDEDGDGVGYRLRVKDVHVVNDSGYPLDLETLGMGVLRFSNSKGSFTVPMQRVNEPGNGWLGLAQVWVSNRSGFVDRALVSMNEGYPEMREPVIATRVGCMEVLHTVGLAHQEEGDETSCMTDCSTAANWGQCMRNPAGGTPNPHDQEMLERIYEMEVEPPTVCVQGEFTLLTFRFPAPGESHHGAEL